MPIPNITQHGPSASHVIKVEGSGSNILFSNLDKALKHTDTQLRLFGKPSINGERRMGVVLARALASIQEAREKATRAVSDIEVDFFS